MQIYCRVVFSLLLIVSPDAVGFSQSATPQPVINARVVNVLQLNGLLFKDLNKNGKLDVYEDWRRSIDERVNDLVAQMTIEEKAGLMVGPTLSAGPGGTVNEQAVYGVNPFNPGPVMLNVPATTEAVNRRHIRQFINRENLPPKTMANWLNGVQQIAEGSRLGIPVIFVTNPRNHYGTQNAFGIIEAGNAFSQWPGPLGLAAMRDTALVEEFARIAAQEYVSVGIRGAYHPTADVATEPRWNRFRETFGEDAKLTTEIITALIRGFQGEKLGPHSVALTTKHFPGAGPADDGQDAHFPYGKNQVYPGKNLEYHLQPWKAAIAAGTAMIMPYYAVPKGMTSEDLGMAYNKEIITDLLRNKLGYTGVVNSDTGISTGMPWGVENLSVKDRYKKAIEAGVDRIGGDATPELIVELVKSGGLTEARIDESARRILRVYFGLGIFENPYANPEEAERTVRKKEFQEKADLAQRKSIVLLKNANNILPLKKGVRMYVEGLDAAVAAQFGYVSTNNPDDADVCIVRVNPAGGGPGGGGRGPGGGRGGAVGGRPGGGGPGGGFAGGGRPGGGGQPIDLTIPAARLTAVRALMQKKPTIIVMQFDSPYVIPELANESAALLATFGVTDEALFDVLMGKFNPTGKLPFELPSSMDAVREQLEDLPYDSKAPLFKFGSGLSYSIGR
ncbi:MAG: glycoside hydrolase family 3 C-terminal domain-containing protein [Acidobacteria bacterium]|nr:glycoside hydrolase family 3 C-terminal domain-containing protein [Acidobacteriota bacterium]MBI3424134.1 glycoside hydrolase family 3 C-terminal domain-containing protein [Acidobacteriota bacterium]